MKLLLLLFLCHYLADYTWLSRPFMLAAKRFGRPLWPISEHAAVHGLLTLLALLACGVRGWPCAVLALVEYLSHFGIDVLKGRLNARYQVLQNPANVVHWVVFGGDQYLHAVVLILIWHWATLLA